MRMNLKNDATVELRGLRIGLDSRIRVVNKSSTVLVIEDDAELRELLRVCFQMAGHRVIAVEDGGDALQYIETNGLPDVVVLDLCLDHVSGIDVCREIRQRRDGRTLPVIVVTGSAPEELDVNDFQGFLRKPVKADEVLDAVETALLRHRLSSTELSRLR